MLLTLILVGAAAFLYFFCKKRYNFWAEKGVPQNDPTWILGSQWRVLFAKEHISEGFRKLINEFPDAKYSGFYNFLDPRLVIRDPELIKDITIRDFDHFVDRTQFIDTEHEKFFGRNLFALKGQKWKNSRAILTPSFTGNKMRSMFILVTKCCETFVKFFQDKNEDIIEVDINDVITRFTNDAIASAAFGVEINSLQHRKNDFYVMGQQALKITADKALKIFVYQLIPPLYKWLLFEFIPVKVQNFFTNIVADIIKVRKEKGIIRPDVIHLLSETKKSLESSGKKNITIDNDDIVANAFLFFFGGLDTVSSGLDNLLFELAVHQNIQDKLRAEILDAKKTHGDDLSYDVLMQMKYMEMVVSESFRKWCPMPILMRKCTKTYVMPPALPGGDPLEIQPETSIVIPTFNIQRDPKYFPDPLKFDPERFNEKNKPNINPYAYIPFGAGPRTCIGSRFALMEVKALTFYILSSFKVVLTEKTNTSFTVSPTSFSPRPDEKLVLGLQKLKL